MQQGSTATATLTDEQILGIATEPPPSSTPSSVPNADPWDDTAPGGPQLQPRQSETPSASPAAEAAPDAPNSPSENDVEPAWLAALESNSHGGPAAAAEARGWRAAAKDSAQLDAAYFSADPGARSGLAAQLYDTDPGAFRDMLAAGARMLSERDPQGLAELARQLGAAEPQALPPAAKSLSQAVRPDARTPSPAAAAPESPAAFPVETYRAFQAGANDDVARRVQHAIDNTLRATLPEGVAEGARRRIGEDIFEEVHASLAADRDLARQVGEALRDWRFDATSRRQVTSLLAGRGRAVLPEVARRVVAEWTSSVLASDRARSARIDAAASRRDITGGRLPETVPSSALRGRDIDYGRMTDEQILEL